LLGFAKVQSETYRDKSLWYKDKLEMFYFVTIDKYTIFNIFRGTGEIVVVYYLVPIH